MKFEEATLFSIYDTILSFERSHYNPYQNRAGKSAPSFTTVKHWVAEIKRGRTSCQDERRSGRPNYVTTPKMVKKINKMVLDERRLKMRQLADMVSISKSVVHQILTENLDMRTLCARWVPHLLTMEQKQRLEDVAIEYLAMAKINQ